MKVLIWSVILTVLSFSSFAKNVELQISSKWKKDDVTKEANTRVIAKIGQEWEIPFNGTDSLKIRMTVNDEFDEKTVVDNESSTELMFNGQILGIENGKESVIASPKVITVLGKEAILTMKDDNGEFLELKIKPTSLTEDL